MTTTKQEEREENTLFNKESLDDLYFKKEMFSTFRDVFYHKKSKGKNRVLDIYNSLTPDQFDGWKNLVKSIKNYNLDMAMVILKEVFLENKRDAEIITLEIMMIELQSDMAKVEKKLKDYLFNQKLT